MIIFGKLGFSRLLWKVFQFSINLFRKVYYRKKVFIEIGERLKVALFLKLGGSLLAQVELLLLRLTKRKIHWEQISFYKKFQIHSMKVSSLPLQILFLRDNLSHSFLQFNDPFEFQTFIIKFNSISQKRSINLLFGTFLISFESRVTKLLLAFDLKIFMTKFWVGFLVWCVLFMFRFR
jgi:hypothetical protein